MVRMAAVVALSIAGLASSPRWTATLGPQGDSKVTGTATVEAAASSMADTAKMKDMDHSKMAGTKVWISVKGLDGTGQHAWHMHRGTCAAVGAVVGTDSSYPVLQPGADGSAEGTASLSMAAPTSGSYLVAVHSGPTGESSTISCGELRAGGAGNSGN
ncbi:MAG: hypothetical protein ABI647_03900 [Gemmatimonadota bacterium]